MDSFYRMTPLEVASGWVAGYDQADEEDVDGTGDPLAALGTVLLPALERPPCFVEFSGGRDSSAILAAAVDLARRHGLALPVPMTRVFPDVPESREDEWQKQVLRHLQVEDWHRTEYTDELDLLGPVAVDSLRRHGLLWPATIHVVVPTWEVAAGGSVVSGEGGDEVFGLRRITALTGLLAGRVHPRRKALALAINSLAPTPIRRWMVSREVERRADRLWLREAALREFRSRLVDDMLVEPLSWDAATRGHRYRRADRLGRHNFRLAAAMSGVSFLTPLHHPIFLAALANRGGRLGFPGRSAAMRELFGDLLPPAVLERNTKAEFTAAYFRKDSRAFIEGWEGEGVEEELVDADVLKQEWRKERPHAGTLLLLQAAWLKTVDLG